MDKIIIKNLLLKGILGIYPKERVNKQDMLVNIILSTNIRQCAKTENVEDTVDYERVIHRVTQHVNDSFDLLLEKLTTDLAEIILKEFERVEKVHIRIEKPQAIPQTESVGIEIERTRLDFPLPINLDSS